MAERTGAAFWTYRFGVSVTTVSVLFLLGSFAGLTAFPRAVYVVAVAVGILLLLVSVALRKRAKPDLATAPQEVA